MSSPNEPRHHGHDFEPQDAVESVVPAMPIVLPMVGAALMFLLAFIAVYLA
ncbi:hypothetical protein GCM10028796_19610 [Ramlibacter monticola]|uniref:Uncharacterized protein n=1 Tax=Ramlibacter monticola TaxID=1926872 RepID=A0A936Z0M3_9BURK|nr:hypothetical protein [Ramlibacter monticola]MBL0392217.1 hypothetical protein [Ramlibacter monticola]